MTRERDQAASDLAVEERTYADLQTRIEGLEGDVEAARSEVFAAVNAATALRHAMEHASAARARIGEQIAKLEAESHDLRVEAERAAHDRAIAETGLQQAREAIEALRLDRLSRESELTAARTARETRSQEFRDRRSPGRGAGRAAAVARGTGCRAGGIRRWRAAGAGGVERRRRADGIGGRLPRGRWPVRAGGRGLPRRPPGTRRRFDARGSVSRTAVRVRPERRPRWVPHRVRSAVRGGRSAGARAAGRDRDDRHRSRVGSRRKSDRRHDGGRVDRRIDGKRQDGCRRHAWPGRHHGGAGISRSERGSGRHPRRVSRDSRHEARNQGIARPHRGGPRHAGPDA